MGLEVDGCVHVYLPEVRLLRRARARVSHVQGQLPLV